LLNKLLSPLFFQKRKTLNLQNKTKIFKVT